MFSRLSIALRQQLLTTSFLISSAFGFSAFGQKTTPDTAQWSMHYQTLKTKLFMGKDTTVNAKSVWFNHEAAIPASTIGQQQFYAYLQHKAAQDSYHLSVQTHDQDGNPVQNLYNTIDSTLTKQAQTGVSLGRQNATLIKTLNFDDKAWPEFTMAKYVLMSAPKTTLYKNSNVTYQTLINQTKSTVQSKPDYNKAAVLLQLISGMTETSPHVNEAAFNTLKATARHLISRLNISNPAIQAEIFKQAVDTHHALIQKPVMQYVTKNQTALQRIAPALTSIPAHVQKIIPDLEIKNRTRDPQHQMRESVAGFYQLVGHDAYDLLDALQKGKGDMLLSDFYKTIPRYNKTAGRAAQRAHTVLSKALLRPYHNAGYGDEFSVSQMLKTYTVANACFDGTQRLVIPTKPTHVTTLRITPVAQQEPIVVTDTVTVEKHTDSTVVIEKSKPYGSVGLGTDHWTHESFGTGITDRTNGSSIAFNSINASLKFEHDFAGGGHVDRNNRAYYKQGFFGVGLGLEGAVGRANFNRRDDHYDHPAAVNLPSISTTWGVTSGAHVRVGPLTGYTGLSYTENPVTDKLTVTYSATLNLASFIGKKGGVHTFGIQSESRDANLRWNNGGDLPPRSDINPIRAASQNGITYTYKKGAINLDAFAGVNDTYITAHKASWHEYIKTATQIGAKDSPVVNIKLRYNLGGQKKTTTTVTQYAIHNGVISDSTSRTQETKQHVTPLERGILTNYRITKKEAVQKTDSIPANPYEPTPVQPGFQQTFRPGQ